MAATLKYLLAAVVLSLLMPAFSMAGADSQYRLIVFEGSDWCTNCIRFEKKVLSNTDFKAFLDTEAIQVERVDFPQRKKLDKATRAYNAEVAEQYQFDGKFPTILLVNASTNSVVKLNYLQQDAATFIALIKAQVELHAP